MPGAADGGVKEPEHELAVVQQVQKGSIAPAGTKAQLTVKLPGVASADDVQVRCTSSSVSVAVPGRYLLQLSLPFCINDQAESVKFSSKKQPATLTVTMAVEGSITQQLAMNAPAPLPAVAVATCNSSQGIRQRRGQQQQQQQLQQQPPAEAIHSSSSSCSSMPPPMPSHDEVVGALLAGGPTDGEDRSQWLLPCALAFDWMDRGSCDAMVSLLWTLSLYELPPGKEPQHLVRLTPRNIVLALLAAVLMIVVNVFVIAYMLGCFITQGCACVCVTVARTSHQLTPAYLAYIRALNSDNSAAPTVLKLAQCWLAYSTLWWLVTLLRVNLLLGWLWRNILWPLLLGLVWQPRIVTTVPLALVSFYCGMTCVAETYKDPVFSFFIQCYLTQVMILILGGGWQTVAMLLLATAFHLPRLPRHYLWPCFAWCDAVVTATGFLAPFWPLWWQRWLAAAALVWFLKAWAPDALQKYRAKRS